MMWHKIIKVYTAEPIVKLIVYHVVFIILVAVITFYTRHHAEYYYEKPAQKKIINHANKEKLGYIIIRELLRIDADYNAILRSKNTKKIKNLSKKIFASIEHAQEIIPVFQNGGTIIDVIPVNFYDKDEVREKIIYLKESKDKISLDVIDLAPKFIELKKLLEKSFYLLIDDLSKENPANKVPDNFELIMVTKQSETYLLRLQESANKIFFDIKHANHKLEDQIAKSRIFITKIVLIIDIAGISLVILFAFLIAIKIFAILKVQKSTKARMKRANKTLNTIIDNIPVGVALVSSEKRILQINEQASKILGYDSLSQAQEIIGTHCGKSFCETEEDKCPILDLGKSKVLFTEKNMIPSENITGEIAILKSVIPITLDDQYVLMEVFVDISERKRYEQAIKNNQENLECLVRERTKELKKTQKELISKGVEAGRAQLSAMVLHNIGNAITPVNVNLKMLETKKLQEINQYLAQCYTDLKEHQHNLTEYVTIDDRGKRVASYLGELIDSFEKARNRQNEILQKIDTGFNYVSDILTLQQSYSSGVHEMKQSTNFNSLVKDSIKMQQSALEKRNITVIENFQNNIPNIVIEKNKFLQMVVNLIKNASDAITQLHSSDTQQKEPFIRITTSFDDSISEKKIRLSILDSGIGIEENKLDTIFDFGISTKGSSGFGLYYCKSFLEANEGTITVESPGAGQGATFFMEIACPGALNET